MDLINNIYNRKKLNKYEVKVAKEYFATLDFITIEDNYRTLPRKILTTKGILKLIDDFDNEADKVSELTNTVALSKEDFFNFGYYLSKNSYEIYKNIIVLFLLTHKNILIEYLNKKYGINLCEKDISKKYILENSEEINQKIKFSNKRNIKNDKNIKYIKVKNIILKIIENNIYKIKGEKYETSRYIDKRKYRRNGKCHQNERSFSITTVC